MPDENRRGLSTEWFSHLSSKEDKDSFEGYVRNSVSLIERLQQIIDKRIQEAATIKADDYDSPSWAYKQADRNGVIRTLKNLRKLTEHINNHD